MNRTKSTLCPRCKKNERAKNQSYCRPCISEYVKARTIDARITKAAMKEEILRLRTLLYWCGVDPDAK